MLPSQYTLTGELGRGANATVYLAFDNKHRRQVAIKILHPELTASLAGERFLREIAIAAQLQHPHILPLLDSGETDGRLYFVMPFVEGQTLRARLERNGPLAPTDVVRILADLADALSYAHDRGIVHRDIKPDNVILAGRHAVVMDFGVAKALDAAVQSNLTTGVALGTPTYMAPEQALAQPNVDHRADLYALGVLGYELLCGAPPFGGPGRPVREVLAAQISEPPVPIGERCPAVPESLAHVVMRCLEKRPEARWPNAVALASALDQIQTPDPGSTPTSVPAVSGRGAKLPWLLGALAVVAIVVALWRRFDRPPVRSPATVQQLTFLGNVLEARPSSDGQFVAFVTGDSSGQRLWVQDRSGSPPISLASGQEFLGLHWFNHDAEIGFAERAGLRSVIKSMPRLGGPAKALGFGFGFVSPDGRRLAGFSAGSPVIRIRDLATGDSTVLSRDSTYRWITGIAWSYQSDRLVLTLAGADVAGTALEVIPVRGTRSYLWRDSAVVLAPGFSPDGQSIVAISGRSLIRLSLNEQPPRPRVVHHPVDLEFDDFRSPLSSLTEASDGSLVMVQTAASANLALTPVRGRTLGGRQISNLTTGTADHRAAAFSPSGRDIAAIRHEGGRGSLGIIPAAGGPFAVRMSFPEGLAVRWSPDGASLALTTEGPERRLVLYTLETGFEKVVASPQLGALFDWGVFGLVGQTLGNRGLVAVDPATGVASPTTVDTTSYALRPRISPDGKTIAYFSVRPGPVGLTLAPMRPGGHSRMIGEQWWPIRWNTAGDTLFASSIDGGRQGTGVFAIPLAGPPVRLRTLPANHQALDMSPDGTTLLLRLVERRADVWRITP